MDINQIMTSLEAKHPGESEYLQAVKEVLLSIEDIYNQHPEKVEMTDFAVLTRKTDHFVPQGGFGYGAESPADGGRTQHFPVCQKGDCAYGNHEVKTNLQPSGPVSGTGCLYTIREWKISAFERNLRDDL